MTGVILRRDTEIHTHKKRTPWGDKGRDWKAAAANQGKPSIASKLPEAGKRQRKILLQVSEGTWPG